MRSPLGSVNVNSFYIIFNCVFKNEIKFCYANVPTSHVRDGFENYNLETLVEFNKSKLISF